MQNAALREMMLDFAYVPFPVSPEALEAAVKGLRALGVQGFNVTIPHKTAVIRFLDGLSPEAELCGAVNTVRREGERLIGHNTDGIGLVRSLEDDLGFDPRGRSILVLGAGGAARGAVLSLCAAGAARVTVANRTPQNAAGLLEQVRGYFPHVATQGISLDGPVIGPALDTADLLLNTTSVGMNGSSFPDLDLGRMKKSASVYDMVYSPPVTPLMLEAQRHGLCCSNGLGMLAAQGEAAFALWTGLQPPKGFMKNCLDAR